MKRLAILCLAWALAARADIESPALRAGLAAYEKAELERAVELCTRALGESLTREEKLAALRTLAFAEVALGNSAAARRAFLDLLRFQPDFELDARVSPRVRSLFEEARNQVATQAVPVARELAPKLTRAGDSLQISLEHGGGLAQRAIVFHRPRGARAYSRLEVAGHDGRFDATILHLQPPGLELYLLLVDDQGLSVAHAGWLSSPLTVEVAPTKKPLHKRAWFWGTLAGSVVTVLVVGLAVGLAPRPVHLVVQPE